MTDKKMLERASKLQKECAKFCKENKEIYSIDDRRVLISARLFHELEREEGLLEHIGKELKKEHKTWFYSAMTQDGVKIISNENEYEVNKTDDK